MVGGGQVWAQGLSGYTRGSESQNIEKHWIRHQISHGACQPQAPAQFSIKGLLLWLQWGSLSLGWGEIG